MRPIHIQTKTIIKLFENTPVLTMEKLTTELNCSHMTVFRKLCELHYFSSYTHKGKYYTLTQVARFNNNGLWEYQGIRFSLYGNLKNTVLQFVNHSQAGYSADELEKLLVVRVNNTLFALLAEGQLVRDSYGRKYIYFSGNDETRKFQKKNREKKLLQQTAIVSPPVTKTTQLPTDKDVIRILVLMIKNPDADPTFIAKKLAQTGKPINEALITSVWQQYDLFKKKTS
jgi:hypothetical protein